MNESFYWLNICLKCGGGIIFIFKIILKLYFFSEKISILILHRLIYKNQLMKEIYKIFKTWLLNSEIQINWYSSLQTIMDVYILEIYI